MIVKFFFFSILFLWSCGTGFDVNFTKKKTKKVINESSHDINSGGQIDDPACSVDHSFTTIRKIFEQHCDSCHNPTSPAGGLEFISEGSLKKWDLALNAINSGRMPPSGATLSLCQLENLKKYVTRDLNSSDSDNSQNHGENHENESCKIPEHPNFQNNVKPLLDKMCLRCHSNPGKIRVDRLVDHEDIRTFNERWSAVATAIESEQMPPDTNLTPCDKQLFKKWNSIKVEPKYEKHEFKRENWRAIVSKTEMLNILSDILGPISPESQIIKTLNMIQESNDAHHLFLGSSEPLSSFELKVMTQLATDVTMHLLNQKNSSLDTCLTDQKNHDCFKRFGSQLIPLLWRQPMQNQNVTELINPLWIDGDFETSLARLIRLSLESPFFLYKIENTPDLKNIDILNRLTFTLWKSGPDADLLRRIQSMNLSKKDQYQNLLNEMLMDSRSSRLYQDLISSIFLNANLDRSDHPNFFLDGMQPYQIKKDIEQSINKFIDYIAFRGNGSYKNILTSKVAFIDTQNIAQIYNAPINGTPQILEDRPGIMTRAGFLYQPGLYTNPIRRGAAIRLRILCDEVILQGAPQNPMPPTSDGNEMSNRQMWSFYTSDPACFSCHKSMNPLGFVFEKFDSLGRIRNQEKRFNDYGEVTDVFEIDTQVQPRIELLDEKSVTNDAEFVSLLAHEKKSFQCLNRQIFRYLYSQKEKLNDVNMITTYIDGTPKSGDDPISKIIKDFLMRPEFLKARE